MKDRKAIMIASMLKGILPATKKKVLLRDDE
jgi:hypothetical protein